MASEKMTEYERKRFENIRRNDQMMAALKIHSAASQLSAASKRQRTGHAPSSKKYKVSPETQSPVVFRRSLRTRGMPPDSEGLDGDSVEPSSSKTAKIVSPQKPSPRVLGPISTRDAYSGEGSDRLLIDTVLSVKKSQCGFDGDKFVKKEEIDGDTFVKKEGIYGDKFVKNEEIDGDMFVKEEEIDGVLENSVVGEVRSEHFRSGIKLEKMKFENCADLASMTLEPENIARILPGRIMVVRFLPCNEVRMVAAGNKFGNIAFWNVDSEGEEGEEGEGIYLYRPHTGPISGLIFQQACLSKIYTSCYDGFLRLMDAEKEVFDLIYSSDDTIFSLSQRPNDVKSLYFCEGRGQLSIWDERTSGITSQWLLHEDRINTIDFNSQNPNIMVTSSTDGTACLWDLRSVNADRPLSLKTVEHNRAVHSAYFSPSGSSLATTSLDNMVGILSGANFEDDSMIYHYNQTGRWISTFRAIWGWDDSFVFIGNMKRGVDVISPAQGRTIMTLESPHMSAIQCRFDAHPYKIGMLAGGTAGGQVYVWTSS